MNYYIPSLFKGLVDPCQKGKLTEDYKLKATELENAWITPGNTIAKRPGLKIPTEFKDITGILDMKQVGDKLYFLREPHIDNLKNEFPEALANFIDHLETLENVTEVEVMEDDDGNPTDLKRIVFERDMPSNMRFSRTELDVDGVLPGVVPQGKELTNSFVVADDGTTVDGIPTFQITIEFKGGINFNYRVIDAYDINTKKRLPNECFLVSDLSETIDDSHTTTIEYKLIKLDGKGLNSTTEPQLYTRKVAVNRFRRLESILSLLDFRANHWYPLNAVPVLDYDCTQTPAVPDTQLDNTKAILYEIARRSVVGLYNTEYNAAVAAGEDVATKYPGVPTGSSDEAVAARNEKFKELSTATMLAPLDGETEISRLEDISIVITPQGWAATLDHVFVSRNPRLPGDLNYVPVGLFVGGHPGFKYLAIDLTEAIEWFQAWQAIVMVRPDLELYEYGVSPELLGVPGNFRDFKVSSNSIKLLWDVRFSDGLFETAPNLYLRRLSLWDKNLPSSAESLVIQNPYADGDSESPQVLYRGAYNAPVFSTDLSTIYNNPGLSEEFNQLKIYRLLNAPLNQQPGTLRFKFVPESEFCKVEPWITASPRGELFNLILPADIGVPDITVPYIDDNTLPSRFEPRENGIGVTLLGNKFTIDEVLNNDHTSALFLSSADLNEESMNTLTEKLIDSPRLDVNVWRIATAVEGGEEPQPLQAHSTLAELLKVEPELGAIQGRFELCLSMIPSTTPPERGSASVIANVIPDIKILKSGSDIMAQGEYLGTLSDGSNLFVGNHSGFYGDTMIGSGTEELKDDEGKNIFPQGTASAIGDLGVTVYRQRYNKVDEKTGLPLFYSVPVDSVRSTDEDVVDFTTEQQDSEFAKTEEILWFYLDPKSPNIRRYMDQIDLISLYSSDGPDRMKQHQARKILSPDESDLRDPGLILSPILNTVPIAKDNDYDVIRVLPEFSLSADVLESMSYKFVTQEAVYDYLYITSNVDFKSTSAYATVVSKFAKGTPDTFEDQFAPKGRLSDEDIVESGGLSSDLRTELRRALSLLTEYGRSVRIPEFYNDDGDIDPVSIRSIRDDLGAEMDIAVGSGFWLETEVIPGWVYQGDIIRQYNGERYNVPYYHEERGEHSYYYFFRRRRKSVKAGDRTYSSFPEGEALLKQRLSDEGQRLINENQQANFAVKLRVPQFKPYFRHYTVYNTPTDSHYADETRELQTNGRLVAVSSALPGQKSQVSAGWKDFYNSVFSTGRSLDYLIASGLAGFLKDPNKTVDSLVNIGQDPHTLDLITLGDNVEVVDYKEDGDRSFLVANNGIYTFRETVDTGLQARIVLREGMNTNTVLTSSALIGALDDEIKIARYYDEAGGFTSEIVNEELTLPGKVTSVAALFSKHKLVLFSVEGEPSHIYCLAMGQGRQIKGFTRLRVNCEVNKLVQLDHDRIGILTKDCTYAELNFSDKEHMTDDVAERVEGSFESNLITVPYKYIIRPMPLLSINDEDFSVISKTSISKIILGICGNPVFKYEIVSDVDRALSQEREFRRNDPDNVLKPLNYNGQLVIENLPQNGVNLPELRITKEDDQYIEIASINMYLGKK